MTQLLAAVPRALAGSLFPWCVLTPTPTGLAMRPLRGYLIGPSTNCVHFPGSLMTTPTFCCHSLTSAFPCASPKKLGPRWSVSLPMVLLTSRSGHFSMTKPTLGIGVSLLTTTTMTSRLHMTYASILASPRATGPRWNVSFPTARIPTQNRQATMTKPIPGTGVFPQNAACRNQFTVLVNQLRKGERLLNSGPRSSNSLLERRLLLAFLCSLASPVSNSLA